MREEAIAGVSNHDYFLDQEYMSQDQLNFFKEHLLNWRSELTGLSEEIMQDLKEGDLREADPVDYGSLQAQKERGILAKRRNNQLIGQIEHALYRINQGEFGYCEMTGEEIGIKRLIAMPLATLSIEAQELLERKSRRLYTLN